GIAQGLSVGDNTRAAVISRGLAELTRLGVAMGAEPATMAGLAGMGDLIATCVSPLSRNRQVGERLGKGESIDEILGSMNMVAEGKPATERQATLFIRYSELRRHPAGRNPPQEKKTMIRETVERAEQQGLVEPAPVVPTEVSVTAADRGISAQARSMRDLDWV